MAERSVAVLVGSLRKGSLNRKMALALTELAKPTLALELVEIRDIDFYDQDREEHAPASWQRFREAIRRADAVLFVTPEYNRSVPGVLKNAIDVGSRPSGESAWKGKPAAVVTVSPGALGGFGANHHLRQSLVSLDMPSMQQPEMYVGRAADLFDESGAIGSERTRDLARSFVEAFAAWIERFAPPGA